MSSPRRQLMAEQWDQFARTVLTKNVPDVQRREMRRAFYAGAHAILFRVIDSLTDDSEPTAEDLALLQGLHDELQEFSELLKSGRA